MYERVWSGELNYPDEAKWDLALDFDQETGLFRCSGSLNGGAIEAHECADPVIAGYMEKSDDKIVLDSRWMPLIPAAPLEMQGRFAPFSSPDQIVSGTWRTPKDWPEARKAATVEDLETRMLYIVSSDDEIKSYRMAVRECSRLLNGMFGGRPNGHGAPSTRCWTTHEEPCPEMNTMMRGTTVTCSLRSSRPPSSAREAR